jgi:hypothetical protein
LTRPSGCLSAKAPEPSPLNFNIAVQLALQGYQPTTLVVELKESAYLGVIFLSQL